MESELEHLLLGPKQQEPTKSSDTMLLDPLPSAVPAPTNEYDPGHPRFESYRQAIKNIESSGGNYQATGPEVTYSDGSKDRAHGAYQVMGVNVGPWTEAALGRRMSIPEFRASREAQDKVFEHQSKLQYLKYQNWDDVGSVWFSGQPLKGNNASDGNKTVPQYVGDMRAYMSGSKPGLTPTQGGSYDEPPTPKEQLERMQAAPMVETTTAKATPTKTKKTPVEAFIDHLNANSKLVLPKTYLELPVVRMKNYAETLKRNLPEVQPEDLGPPERT